MEKTVAAIRMQQRDVLSWEEMLHNSCKHSYQEKLVVKLLALFREDIDIKKPVQVTVLTNLVGKLKGCQSQIHTTHKNDYQVTQKTTLGNQL